MQCHYLTDRQLERIHQASLTILAEMGVMVPHPNMLQRFADHGAPVDFVTQRVRIPADLVMQLLGSAGKQFTLYGRDLQHAAAFGQGKRNYNATAGQASWLDIPGGERRYAALSDVVNAARIADALPHLTIAGAMADPHDVPISYRCVEVMATMLKHTSKPLTFWFHDRASARFLLELQIALRGDEQRAAAYPICFPLLEPISPLRFPFHGIDLLYETARMNLPVPVGPMAQMGLSAPMSLAGTMAQQNAEVLAGICITQLVRPGMPVCYGGICHAFDMGTTQLIFGGPEQAIFGMAMTQLGKWYGLPVYVNSGLTDAKRPDAQAGLEAGITLATSAMAQADIFGHLGIAGVDQAGSLEMLLLQHEIIAYTEAMLREVDFSDEALGLDVLADVQGGGSFIEHEHTLARFRRELWFPDLLDRNYYQVWLDNGAQSTEDRCRQRVQELLATHEPEPLAPELAQAFDDIVAAAKRALPGS